MGKIGPGNNNYNQIHSTSNTPNNVQQTNDNASSVDSVPQGGGGKAEAAQDHSAVNQIISSQIDPTNISIAGMGDASAFADHLKADEEFIGALNNMLDTVGEDDNLMEQEQLIDMVMTKAKEFMSPKDYENFELAMENEANRDVVGENLNNIENSAQSGEEKLTNLLNFIAKGSITLSQSIETKTGC